MEFINLKNGRILLLAILVIGISSCKKDGFLSVPPEGVLTSSVTFATQSNADLYVNDIYDNLPDMNNYDDILDGWTDNNDVGATFMVGQSVIRSNAMSAGNEPTGGDGGYLDWAHLYSLIRKCNGFLQNAAANQSAYSATWYTQRVAEVKFLRAFFYTYLYTNYGGVPLITVPLDNENGTNIFYPRSTIDQTEAFIVADCAAAAAALPVTQDSGDLGRPTKGAALTLEGWVQLFYASPLVNTSNDLSRWANAAATNLAVINLGTYSLFNPANDTAAFKDQFLAINNWNSETIFAKAYALPGKGHKREGILGPVIVNGGEQAWGNIIPTQNLVDDYQMDNGLPITDPNSGYNPQKPYVGRESRFYQTVVYDGSTWQGEIWESRIGGNNQIDLGSSSDISNTGYNGRKTLDESINGQLSLGQSPNTSNYQFYRYAEVLLSYAEAQNEAVGPDASVYSAVNAVRARVALPALPGGLSQQAMRTDIRRERRLELAFEDKRWYDIRRWDITTKPGPDGYPAAGVLTSPEYGMVITKGSSGALIYTPTVTFNNRYTEYMNWLPISQSVLSQNTKLTQNPGYK